MVVLMEGWAVGYTAIFEWNWGGLMGEGKRQKAKG
jgi:hypothetical protein